MSDPGSLVDANADLSAVLAEKPKEKKRLKTVRTTSARESGRRKVDCAVGQVGLLEEEVGRSAGGYGSDVEMMEVYV